MNLFTEVCRYVTCVESVTAAEHSKTRQWTLDYDNTVDIY